jgi:hypothetical protein
MVVTQLKFMTTRLMSSVFMQGLKIHDFTRLRIFFKALMQGKEHVSLLSIWVGMKNI